MRKTYVLKRADTKVHSVVYKGFVEDDKPFTVYVPKASELTDAPVLYFTIDTEGGK